ncbi:TolC family protein [Geopsychrobacter electrodiphilus]|uniref:TolC family protein n=1 Tax=Geopsychrobacter electrodiphilus TaxID=225196 RepID=UPI00037D449F|nr:TolC family protein [Geopsychrobacter electrodiphilus]
MKILLSITIALCLLSCVSQVTFAAEPEQHPRQLTLADAVNLALAANPALTLTRNRQAAANVSVEAAQANFLPDLQAKTRASERYAQDAIPGQGNDSRSLSLGLSSSLNLFNGFADEASLSNARRQLDAAAATLLRQQQATAFNAATAYINVLSNRELVKVAEQNLVREEALRAQIEAFYQAGNRSVTDLYQQQAAKAQAELDLLDARRNLEVALLLLAQSLGQQPPWAVDPQPLNPLALVDSLKGLEPGAALQFALKARPDLIAQNRLVEAAQDTTREAAAGRLPRLDLVASADTGYSSLNSGRAIGAQLSQDNGVATLGLTLSVPIFDRAKTRSEVSQARIAEQDATVKVVQLRQQIGVEVGQAVADYRRAELQLTLTQAQLKFARQALDAALARYQAGAASWVERATARTTFVQTAGAEVRARYALLQQGLAVGYARGDIQLLLTRIPSGKE